MSMNDWKNKERKSEKPIWPCGGEQGTEWRRRTEEELYRVVLLWSFHRRWRQRESVTGIERKAEEKKEGEERGANTQKDRQTLIGREWEREKWTLTDRTQDKRGVGRNRKIYIHMRYRHKGRTSRWQYLLRNPSRWNTHSLYTLIIHDSEHSDALITKCCISCLICQSVPPTTEVSSDSAQPSHTRLL